MKSTAYRRSLRNVALTACLSAPFALSAANPLYKWSFDTGFAGTPPVTAGGGTLVPNGTADFLGAGASGNANDKSLNLSNTYTGGAAASGNTNSALAGGANVLTGVGTLSNFTVTMWVKVAAGSLSVFPRLLELGPTTSPDPDGNPGISIILNSGNLEVGVNGSKASVPNAGIAADTWKFIALSYDGTASSGSNSSANNALYGTSNTGVVLFGSLSKGVAVAGSSGLNRGPAAIGTSATLYLGNNAGNARGYTGLIDDVRIYNTQLTVAELEAIRLESAPPPPATGVPYYWKGGTSTAWNASNWTSDLAGTTPAALPTDGSAGAVFTATGAANFTNTLLGAAQNVKSIAFNNQATAVDIGGTNSLTVGAAGIAVDSAAGAVSLSTTGGVTLGANQTWTNNSASPLTVSSPIGGAFVLTTGGSGQTILSAANTHSGTGIQGGTLTLGNASGFGAAGASLNVEAGTVDLNGLSPQIGHLSGAAGGFIVNRASGTTSTLGINTPALTTDTFGGSINNGSSSQVIALTKTGAGTLVLTQTSNFTGNILVSGGTLTSKVSIFGLPNVSSIGSAQVSGRTVTIQNGATFDFGNFQILGNQGDFSRLPAFIVEAGGTVSASWHNIIGPVTLQGGTLTQSSNDGSGYEFEGPIVAGGGAASVISSSNNKPNLLPANTSIQVDAASSLTVSAPLADLNIDTHAHLTKTGPGTLTLAATNTYTGPTTLSEGKLSLSSPTSLSATAVLEVSTSASATLDLNYTGTDVVSGFTIDGVAGSGGTYGSIGSGATHTYSWITGTGLISVPQAAPAAPSDLTATAGAGLVNLTWSASSGADSYKVLSSTTSGGPYATVVAGITATSYTNTGLSAGTTYYYVVVATNTGGDSAASSEASATPSSALTGLQSWRQSHFGTTAGTGNAADNADPDADGIANLLEYALGGDPLVSSPGLLPVQAVNAGHLQLTFNRIADQSLIYSVQASDTLASWSEVWSSTGAQNTAGSVTAADPEALSAHARRFLRLQVTTP